MAKSDDIADVCIVGAGLAGGLLAFELARRGVRVVVVEAGPRHALADRWSYMERRLRGGASPWQGPAARDVFTTAGEVAYPLNDLRVKGVGGTTLHWGALCHRLQESDFRMRSLFGIADDWPIDYAQLEPYYERAESALRVAGAVDGPFGPRRRSAYPLPPFPYSSVDELFIAAGGKLDIPFQHPPFARNSVAQPDAPACQAYATCGLLGVCPIRAQYTAEQHVDLALATGNATLLTEASARRLNTDASGRIASVAYTRAGRDEELRARHFVLAAHAVESSRLLLLSASTTHRDGLANRSGLVGKYLMEHPVLWASGIVAENTFPLRIGFHTAESLRYCATDGRDEIGAFRIACLNTVGPTPSEIARASGRWGAELEEEIRAVFGRRVGMHVFFECLPEERNAVTLDPVVRDVFGDPAPRVTYSVGPYVRETRTHAVKAVGRILDAVGATDCDMAPAGAYEMCGHQIGTTRMGDDPERSVVDANLRAHDVPNLFLVGSGVFVTAGPLNPSLTIAAMALRLADHMTGG